MARLSGAGAVGVRARRHGGVSVCGCAVALLRSCAVASRCRVVAVLHRRVALLRSCAVASRPCGLAPSRRAVAVLCRRVVPSRCHAGHAVGWLALALARLHWFAVSSCPHPVRPRLHCHEGRVRSSALVHWGAAVREWWQRMPDASIALFKGIIQDMIEVPPKFGQGI